MKRRTQDAKVTMSRKEFLRAFAGLVTYSAPAAVALQQLGCSGGGGSLPGDGDAGSNCSVSGSSVSCETVCYSGTSITTC